MSLCKPYKDFTKEELAYLKKKGKVFPRADAWNPYPPATYLYRVDDNGVCWFPFALKDKISIPPNKKKYKRNGFEALGTLFTKETDPSGLERDQKTVLNEGLLKLKKDGFLFVNCSTGFGKSALTVHLSSKVKYGKIMIWVFNQQVQKQWIGTFKKFSTANVQLVTGSNPLKEDCNVYIVGLKKASNCPESFFEGISMLIIDEVDQLPTKTLLAAMQKISPKYLVGLSATINRDDNMHQALFSYFGERNTFLVRFIVKEFKVIKYQTDFEPEQEFDESGKIVDNVMVNSIAYNKKRQEMICKLVEKYKDDKILILSKRVEEIENIHTILKDKKESVDMKHRYKKDWDTSQRVLIGGFMSCGRGVDIPGLTLLILASSVNHIEQNEGRIRANKNLIIDIVDKHYIFENRWKKRRTWYLKRGAEIINEIDG